MRDFGPDDLALATSLYSTIADSTARAVLDYLIDHSEQRFEGAALVKHLSLSQHRDVARATYAIGQIAAALDRKRPWQEAQMGYEMSATQAGLFREARNQATVTTTTV